ncbi:Kelch-like protein 24 [Bagarius yarrelli]|uniref:Kelch-like protein 24 n=1 Tax=Bagarius yarrelli TaxID=175774 RepID=A0A556V4U8_BAGYA|nr:Kelch-like protein 24 [Bagarius yarrelli]
MVLILGRRGNREDPAGVRDLPAVKRKVEGDQLIQNAPDCYQLLHEARRYHVLGNEMMSPRTRPRRSTGFSEVIVVVGGCERAGGFNLPYTDCYDPVTGEWKSLAKHPEFTKSEYGVCALRNDILVSDLLVEMQAGIDSDWLIMGSVECGGDGDWNGWWIRVPGLLQPELQVSPVNIWLHHLEQTEQMTSFLPSRGGRINSSYVWMYNSQLNLWIRVASLNKGRWRHKMSVLLGKVQCYDPETNSWLLRSNIPVCKRNITAASLNSLVYVCGGLTKCIYCYDPAQDFWMPVVNIFSRQECCGMSVCNGKIFILGGRGENGVASDSIMCYDPASGILTSVAAMPRPISCHGCITIHRFDEKLHRT